MNTGMLCFVVCLLCFTDKAFHHSLFFQNNFQASVAMHVPVYVTVPFT